MRRQVKIALAEEEGVDVDDVASVVSYISSSSSIKRDYRRPADMPPITLESVAGSGKLYPIKAETRYNMKGIRPIGFSKFFSYPYSPPTTEKSHYFKDFIAVYNGMFEPPVDLNFYEFRPPHERDLLIHLGGYTKNSSAESPALKASMSQALKRLALDEGGEGVWARNWLDPRLLGRLQVPSSSSPGLRFAKAGYKTKRDALPKAVLLAKRELSRILNGILPDRVPCKLAGRGKLVDITSEGKGKEGRLIMVPCIVRHLLGSLASKHYAACLKNKRREKGGSMLGLGPTGGSWIKFGKDVKGVEGSLYMMIDFSGFDQSLPRWLIREAFEYVKSRFSDEPGSNTYWTNEYRELVDSVFALPDGAVFQKKRGVTSGDPWTSIIGCVCNYIILRSVMSRLGYDPKIWVFGDDSIIRFDDAAPSLLQVTITAKSMYGVTVHDRKSHVTRNFHSTPGKCDGANFLSLYWDEEFLPFSKPDSTWKHLLYPEVNQNNDPGWEYVRAIAYYILTFNDKKTNAMVEEYFHYLQRFTTGPSYEDFDLWRLLDGTDLNARDLRFDVFTTLPSVVQMSYLYYHGGWGPHRRGYRLGPVDDLLDVHVRRGRLLRIPEALSTRGSTQFSASSPVPTLPSLPPSLPSLPPASGCDSLPSSIASSEVGSEAGDVQSPPPSPQRRSHSLGVFR
jgi:hypothetical protein